MLDLKAGIVAAKLEGFIPWNGVELNDCWYNKGAYFGNSLTYERVGECGGDLGVYTNSGYYIVFCQKHHTGMWEPYA